MDNITQIVKLNGYDAELTRLDGPPEKVVEKLLKGQSGAGRIDLLAFGERHDEFAAREEITAIMEHNKSYFSTFYAEIPQSKQSLVNQYMSYDPSDYEQLYSRILKKEVELPERLVRQVEETLATAKKMEPYWREKVTGLYGHAPGENQPELRKAYYKALEGMYETAKDDKMKTICFDASGESVNEARKKVYAISDEIDYISAKYELYSSFFEAKDKPFRNEVPEDEYRETLEDVRNDPTTEKATFSMIDDYPTWKDMKQGFKEFAEYMGESPNVTRNDLRQTVQNKLAELDEAYIEAEIERDKIRNPEMAKNIFAQASKDSAQDKTDKAGLILGGELHMLDHPDVPNLIDSVKTLAKENNKDIGIATINIVALEKNDLEKMGGKGIFLGGKKGTDFTILVESKVEAAELEQIKTIPFSQSKAAVGKFHAIENSSEKNNEQAASNKIEKPEMQELYQQFLQSKEKSLISINPLDLNNPAHTSQINRQC